MGKKYVALHLFFQQCSCISWCESGDSLSKGVQNEKHRREVSFPTISIDGAIEGMRPGKATANCGRCLNARPSPLLGKKRLCIQSHTSCNMSIKLDTLFYRLFKWCKQNRRLPHRLPIRHPTPCFHGIGQSKILVEHRFCIRDTELFTHAIGGIRNKRQ